MIAFAFAGSSIQLVPDGTLLLHLALIVAMVALLNATLLKPINRILEERERRTKGRFKEAQILLSAVTEKLREYDSRMREARARGYQLLESERTAATGERERKVSEVKAEVARWLAEEKRRLQTDEDQVRARLQKDAQERAREIGSHILGRPVRQTEQL